MAFRSASWRCPGAGGQGPAEALAEATPGGRVEYVLNATNRRTSADGSACCWRPRSARTASRSPRPPRAATSSSVGAPGSTTPGRRPLSRWSPDRCRSRPSKPAAAPSRLGPPSISPPGWRCVRPKRAPIDSVEWTLDGRVTQVTSDPWALLLDPEQLGDGQHDLAARIISNGRAGRSWPRASMCPPDFLRNVRNAVRGWGLIALLLVGELCGHLPVRAPRPSPRGPGVVTNGVSADAAPQPARRPVRGARGHRLPDPRQAAHWLPPAVHGQPGRQPRVLQAAVPGHSRRRRRGQRPEPSRRRASGATRRPTTATSSSAGRARASRSSRARRARSSTSADLRTRRPCHSGWHIMTWCGLATGVEFVFNQVGLRDKATPESKKREPARAALDGIGSHLGHVRSGGVIRRHAGEEA